MSISSDSPRNANRRLVARLAFGALAMFGFGYSLVPLYQVLCQITGLGGRTATQPAPSRPRTPVDRERWVTIELVAALNGALPWEFKALRTRMRVHPGEVHNADFYAGNRSAEPMTGRAVPSVAPAAAARFFKKIECFCFTEQRLPGHTGRVMPVRFYIEPALPSHIGTVTLSYTFFEAPKDLAGSGPSRDRRRARTAPGVEPIEG